MFKKCELIEFLALPQKFLLLFSTTSTYPILGTSNQQIPTSPCSSRHMAPAPWRAINLASCLTVSTKTLRIKLTLDLTSYHLLLEGNRAKTTELWGKRVKPQDPLLSQVSKPKREVLKIVCHPLILTKLLKELLQPNKSCIRISHSRKGKTGYTGNSDEQLKQKHVQSDLNKCW